MKKRALPILGILLPVAVAFAQPGRGTLTGVVTTPSVNFSAPQLPARAHDVSRTPRSGQVVGRFHF